MKMGAKLGYMREDLDPNAEVIDYVIVYNMSALNEAQQLKLLMYERSLLEAGLILRAEHYRSKHFIKVTVPNEVLYTYAELLRLRMPLKYDGDFAVPDSDVHLNRFFSFLSINKVEKTYKLCAEFSRDKLYLFDEDDPDFFNRSSRITVAAYIIERASSGEMENIGVRPLILQGVVLDAYPLHDGLTTTVDSVRYKLLKNWASMRCWYKTQPLNELRDYFGASVAMYFTWMGFYNKMLITAAICGVVTTIIGMFLYNHDGYTNDICKYNVTMCPLCDKYCPYWRLQSSCSFTAASYFSDNICTIIFSIGMSIWNVLYLVMWQRHMSVVTYNWGLANHHISAEPTRPEYLYSLRGAKRKRLNVLTLTPEPYRRFWTNQFPIFVFTGTVFLAWISLALFIYFSLSFYQITVSQFSKRKHLGHVQLYLTALNTLMNLCLIYVLYYLYNKCALWLTNIEMHRTDTQHENNFFLKLYAYQFVTHYTPVFYLAFIKPYIVGFPGNYVRIFGVRPTECIGASCLVEVMEYIAITMTAKQAFFLIASRYLPVILIYKLRLGVILKYIFRRKEPRHHNQVIDDYKLLHFETRELYEAYLQMVLQFGFVSMFISAFPLAHAFALFYNTIRIRVDAVTILKYHKRPVPRIIKDVGIWMKVVHFITRLSVFTNAFLIASSPRFIPMIVFYLEGMSTRDGTGYLLHTLSKFDTSDFEPGTEPESASASIKYCYYFGYNEPPESRYKYSYTHLHWKVLAGELIFVIAYYILANTLIILVQWIVPKVPTKIEEKIQIENYHINRAVIKQEKKKL